MSARRTLLTSLLLLVACSPAIAQRKPKLPKPGKPAEIVFVGNSYTFYHDLPAFVRALGAVDQPARRLTTTMLTPGGFTLLMHWQAKGEQAPATVIKKQKPDYVVFQEQSRRPFENPQLMDRAAKNFTKACKRSKAVAVWFMTWARQHEPLRQDAISEQYQHVHKKNGGLLAPVGRAWQRLRHDHPDIALHRKDQSHPSTKGTYLAACVLYGTCSAARSPTSPTGSPCQKPTANRRC